MKRKRSSFVIQSACVEDVDEILDLQKIAYLSEGKLHGDMRIPPLVQTRDDWIAQFMPGVTLKLVQDGKIVGSVKGHQVGSCCSIGRLMVHPACQRQGMGTAFMQAIEAIFANSTRYELFTGAKSAGNIRLYEKLGYRIFRHDPEHSLVFMEKEP